MLKTIPDGVRSEDRDRSKTPVVTPAMINAGTFAVENYGESFDMSYLVEAVYIAMHQASQLEDRDQSGHPALRDGMLPPNL